jgi:hypothetical protein
MSKLDEILKDTYLGHPYREQPISQEEAERRLTAWVYGVIGEDIPEATHDQEEQWCVDAVNERLAEQRQRVKS